MEYHSGIRDIKFHEDRWKDATGFFLIHLFSVSIFKIINETSKTFTHARNNVWECIIQYVFGKNWSSCSDLLEYWIQYSSGLQILEGRN